MKQDGLTLGTKIYCTFAALSAVLALTAWFGFHTQSKLSDALTMATGKTQRKIELAGDLDTAKSDMAIATRNTILFTYTKNSGQLAASKADFHHASETLRTALSELTGLLVTEDGRQVASRPVHLTYFIPPKHAVLN